MTFDNPLFVIPALSGAIFVVVGIIMLKFPPKKINGIYGYRTPSAMKNQERWVFAQSYSAKELIKLGLILTASSAIGLFVHPSENVATALGLGMMTLIIVVLILRVEKALKRRFDKD